MVWLLRWEQIEERAREKAASPDTITGTIQARDYSGLEESAAVTVLLKRWWILHGTRGKCPGINSHLVIFIFLSWKGLFVCFNYYVYKRNISGFLIYCRSTIRSSQIVEKIKTDQKKKICASDYKTTKDKSTCCNGPHYVVAFFWFTLKIKGVPR